MKMGQSEVKKKWPLPSTKQTKKKIEKIVNKELDECRKFNHLI